MKIRIDPLDRLTSEVVRRRAGNKCERCLKYHPWQDLQAAHFHGRANHRVRYDLDNLAGLCYGCHSYLDSRALEKVEFFLKHLGKEKFDKLNQRANWTMRGQKKIDKKLIEIVLKRELKKYVSNTSDNRISKDISGRHD